MRSLQILVALVSLGVQVVGGVMIRPTVDKGAAAMPVSLSEFAPGVYYKTVEFVDYDYTRPGGSMVRPLGSQVDTSCLGQAKWTNGKAAARLKYDGFELTCRFQ